MEKDEKVRENRIRRMAARQGMSLMKSRRRDPRAYDYGGYILLDARTSSPAVGDPSFNRGWLDLDEVEQALNEGARA
jgi:hypothetical protein